jgi:hypothetical protein
MSLQLMSIELPINKQIHKHVEFKILTAVNMTSSVSWLVTPCSSVMDRNILTQSTGSNNRPD